MPAGRGPGPADDHRGPERVAGCSAAARLAGRVRLAASLPAADAGPGARRAAAAVVVDIAPAACPAVLPRCAPDVRAGERLARRQLDVVESARGAVPVLPPARLPGPLAEPAVPVSRQRALHGCCRQAGFVVGHGAGILLPR